MVRINVHLYDLIVASTIWKTGRVGETGLHFSAHRSTQHVFLDDDVGQLYRLYLDMCSGMV